MCILEHSSIALDILGVDTMHTTRQLMSMAFKLTCRVSQLRLPCKKLLDFNLMGLFGFRPRVLFEYNREELD